MIYEFYGEEFNVWIFNTKILLLNEKFWFL
jgi:hypothetical protein